MSVVLRQGGVLVTPVLVAACAAVKAELNENMATVAIKMLRVRIKFLPNVQDAQSPNQRGMSVAVPPALSIEGQYRTFISLFDDLVGGADQSQRHGYAERLGSLEFDD